MTAPSGGQRIPAADALAALAAAQWLMMPDGTPRSLPNDLADNPLLASTVVRNENGKATGYDSSSLLTLIGASLPAVAADLKVHTDALAPLEAVAKSLPEIVAHSDIVHDALAQGQAATGQAVAAVQQAARSLATSIGSISQLVAQAYAASATANSRASALEARVAALEGRKMQTWRASGSLPALAVNATTSAFCAWQTVPSPLPTPDQCSVVQVAGNSATLTPTAVSTSGVTVQVKAVNVLLAAPGALQVVAATL